MQHKAKKIALVVVVDEEVVLKTAHTIPEGITAVKNITANTNTSNKATNTSTTSSSNTTPSSNSNKSNSIKNAAALISVKDLASFEELLKKNDLKKCIDYISRNNAEIGEMSNDATLNERDKCDAWLRKYFANPTPELRTQLEEAHLESFEFAGKH